MTTFEIFESTSSDRNGARLGQLCLPRRKPIPTPNHIAITSRGMVPHVTPDMMRRHTSIPGIYVALEDFIEKAPRSVPPVLKCAAAQLSSNEVDSPLRSFIALQEDGPLILAPRRTPPVPCAKSNTDEGISIYTSVGFGSMDSDDYADAVRLLKPDVVVGMADLSQQEKVSTKRIEKMVDRTESWLRELVHTLEEKAEGPPLKLDVPAETAPSFRGPAVFAPVLPVDFHQQGMYLRQLEHGFRDAVSGLAIYDSSIVPDLPTSLSRLPRLALNEPSSPHKLLAEISLGVDLFSIPFIGLATDAGIALDFSFPPPTPASAAPALALGVDMWSTYHAADLSRLRPHCNCHACQKHSRAYIQHLLVAKEMLAWVLLQVHNLHVVDELFAGVRDSLAKGTFERERASFVRCYEAELPEKTGQGPRVRGYQYKSSYNAPKANSPAYRTLGEAGVKSEERANTGQSLVSASLATSGAPVPGVEADRNPNDQESEP